MIECVAPAASEHRFPRPIGIVGAGVGGLALGLALHRRRIPVVIFEARSEAQIGSEGAFLTLAPNGINALRALDLAAEVASAGIVTTGIAFHNEKGRRLGLIDYRSHDGQHGAPSITIRRGVLSATLLAACRHAGIDMRFGRTLTALDNRPDGVTAVLGGAPEGFSALVGADGLWSRVRSLTFPDFPQPRYSGLTGTGGLVDVADVAPTDGLMKMTFGRRAFFGYVKAPGMPVHWFNTYPSREAAPGLVADPADYARRMAALHADDPLPNARIVHAVSSIERRYPLFDVPELPRWHHQRIVLVGDAAHAVTPHSGQGASMAIEDALVLAATVSSTDSLAEAFQLFERLRRARTGQARRVGRMGGAPKFAQGWLALRLRDALMPVFVPAVVRAQEHLYRFRADLAPLSEPQS